MSDVVFPREALTAAIRDAAASDRPTLLTGPPGAGKTSLLLDAARALEGRGYAVVHLDLMGAASSPDRFVTTALGALRADRFADRVREATDLRHRLEAGRVHHAEAVQALFGLWASLDRSGGRPVALLLDEVTEIRSLAYFPGLRQVESQLAASLRARKGGTLLATSFPTRARERFDVHRVAVPPLTEKEAREALGSRGGADVAALLRSTFGWARYVRILLDRLRDGVSVADAWVAEMSRGGRLETACHHTYETLLLRSRGYGISKAVLDAVARDEGANLKALVGAIGRTPGATRDYLQWLVGVDALRMDGKRYRYVDGLLPVWVRLHARGTPATAADLRRAIEVLASHDEAIAPEAENAEAAAPPAEATPPRAPRHDSLMEID